MYRLRICDGYGNEVEIDGECDRLCDIAKAIADAATNDIVCTVERSFRSATVKRDADS